MPACAGWRDGRNDRGPLPSRILWVWILAVGFIMAGCRTVEDTVYDAGAAVTRTVVGVSVESVTTEMHGDLGYLYREGAGPTLVLLHGFGAQKDLWLPLIRELEGDYEIVALDLPGHGENDRSNSAARFRTQDFTDSIEEALERIGLEEVHLVGSSFGGKVAIRYALRHPGRVKTLTLISPAAFHPPVPSKMEKRIAEDGGLPVIETREDFEELADMLFYERPYIPWPIPSVYTRRSAEDREHRQRMWNDIWQHRREIREELADLAMPVFLVWGDSDQVVDVSGVQVFREYVEPSLLEVLVMEKTGHSPMLEHPETLAEKFEAFLQPDLRSDPVADENPSP